MSERASRFQQSSAGPRMPPGTGRVVLGFALGVLFGLVPVYTYYKGRDSVLVGGSPGAVSADSAGTAQSGAQEPKAFASRLTYELSRVPVEKPAPRTALAEAPSGKAPPATSPAPVAPPAKSAAAPPPPVPAAPKPETIATAPQPPAPAQEKRSATPPAEERSPPPRVVNARPISATPPDPRDTTRAIEEEARTTQYRSFAPRVIEGKDIRESDLAKAPAPARPIGGTASDASGRPAQPDLAGKGPEAKAIAPPPVVKPPASPAVAIDDIESRMTATRDWLASAPETTHTIQLMGTSNDEQLKGQLRMLAKLLEPDKIYVFRTIAQGKPSTTVLYGAYPDRRSAAQALEKLPEAVAANKPVVRTVSGIRREQKQHAGER